VSDTPRKPWVVTRKPSPPFVARCETFKEAREAAHAASILGTFWITHDDTGEIWTRSVMGEEWKLTRRASATLSLPTL